MVTTTLAATAAPATAQDFTLVCTACGFDSLVDTLWTYRVLYGPTGYEIAEVCNDSPVCPCADGDTYLAAAPEIWVPTHTLFWDGSL